MKVFIYFIIVIVAVAIVAGFFVVGSPKEQRLRQFDDQRIQHLQNIQWEVVNYWQSKQKLPTKLSDLEDPIRGFIIPKDPETGAGYEYAPTECGTDLTGATKCPIAFALCATFNRPSDPASNQTRFLSKPIPAGISGEGIQSNWDHAAGHVCFERTIDPDFFPPFKKTRN